MLNKFNTPTGRHRIDFIIEALELALESYQDNGDLIKAEEAELLINDMKEGK